MVRRLISAVAGLVVMVGVLVGQDKPKSEYFHTKDNVKIHYLVLGQGTPVILIQAGRATPRAIGCAMA